ncbi:MAG: hypothetical protein LDLANPLL_02837 [Turneriella sp.]|nr:hypothetical protein [Turneriella sp.]
MEKGPVKKIIEKIGQALPTPTQIQGALQGVIGDKLPSSFATEMGFYSQGKVRSLHEPIKARHVVIFVHGNSDTELGWFKKNTPLNFGNRLARDYGVEPLYVRYNSGFAVSENGEKLANLIEALLNCHAKIKRITIIAHSMGGLIAHAAIYHARAQERRWLLLLAQVFLLGTPHEGAPLAKLAEKSEQVLQFIPNPITLMAASVLGLRSRGLKDLSHGQSGLPAENIVLQKKVRYVLVAGGVTQKADGVFNKLVGDGMVRRKSALQKRRSAKKKFWQRFGRLGKKAEVYLEELPGVGHLALRTSDEVYAILTKYFKG